MFDYTAESERCLNCVKPSCKTYCPVGNDIPAFLRLVREGRFRQAVRLVGHPFGEICGYVCPRDKQCSGNCILSKRGQALDVGLVEREVFARYPYEVERLGGELQGLRLAIVGGGVSGITCAVKAYEQGAEVTVYERGELLSTLSLIPSFRLPEQALLRVKNAVYGKIAVENKQIDAQELARLQGRFDAVYVATGLTADYGLGVVGQELACNYKDFLQGDFGVKRVIVVGGGNSAVDCARLALFKGCDVTVVYRRTRADMPAFDREVCSAEREGARFVFNAAPIKLQQTADGLAFTVAETVSEGRGKLTVTDREFTLVADYVVSATGSAFDKTVIGGREVNREDYWQYGNVYLGGDAKGGRLVADAVADGLNAVRKIKEGLCLSTK